jgi:DnaJ domain
MGKTTVISIITPRIETEIQRLVAENGYNIEILSAFATFVLQKEPKTSSKKSSTDTKQKAPSKTTPKPKKQKSLSLADLKNAIYQHFQVKDTTALKKSSQFQMATSNLGKLDFAKKEGWEILHRKFVGVLPGEDQKEGYGCINGIDIFQYSLPWRIFALDPKTATTEQIKTAYRSLSQIYHPDNRETGDARIFDRLTTFYKSLTESF